MMICDLKLLFHKIIAFLEMTVDNQQFQNNKPLPYYI